ncbi:cation-dependent mannose-6-phosphate receptor-like [Glandiceps talaboti]
MKSAPLYPRIGKIITEITSLLTIILLLPRETTAVCSQIDSCSCKTDNGDIIDLKALANNDGTARFSNVLGQDSYTYSYNPCYNFNEQEDDCKNVAACQKSYEVLYYDLGDQNSAEFMMDGNDIIIQYIGYGSLYYQQRTSKVKLVCTSSGSDELVAYGETSSGSTIYTFDLKSSHCCPSSGGGGGGLSAGTILCIIFIVLVTLYIVVGILYMKFVREAEGTDLIPNKMFWISLPGLIKDGVLFVLRPCRKGSTPYDEI